MGKGGEETKGYDFYMELSALLKCFVALQKLKTSLLPGHRVGERTDLN
jgi:hypothetical protein